MPSLEENDVARPLEAARQDVEDAARRVIQAWLTVLVGSAGLAVAAAGAAVLLFLVGRDAQPWTLLLLVGSAALVWNAVRFVPTRHRSQVARVRPSRAHAPAISDWVATHAEGWRPAVRFEARPEVYVDRDQLVLGLPLVAGVREWELAALVRDARDVVELDDDPMVRRARRATQGALGHALRRRGDTDSWARRLLRFRIDSRVDALALACDSRMQSLRAARDDSWHEVAARAETVAEAWTHLVRQWLAPALRRRCWHADPFSGLSQFLDGCERQGLVDVDPARLPGPDAWTEVPHVADYESRLASALLGNNPRDKQSRAWSEHPAAVTEPTWRATLAAGLEGARRASGRPQPASLGNVLRLVEDGWAASIVAAWMPTGGSGQPEPSPERTAQVIGDLVEASISVALLDNGAATLVWQWPFGSCLVDDKGEFLAVGPEVRGLDVGGASDRALRKRVGALRSWLEGLGLDVDPPMPLAGPSTSRETPGWEFPASHRRRVHHVVLSEGVLHVYLQDDLVDDLDLTEVDRAEISTRFAGRRWRLELHTGERQLVLAGRGDGREVEARLAALLDDRLVTRVRGDRPAFAGLDLD